MVDYKEQVELLKEWNILDIQNHPTLTLGMMRSAAVSIMRLYDEVDRLNRENFWLSQNREVGNNG